MRVAMGILGAAVLMIGIAVSAAEPMFVRWLVADDPGDQTIRDYWERAERGELEAAALVDLGTMVFYRGFAKDAIGIYRRALDLDKELYEAWFRIGLVEHSRGELGNARQAYERCLKKRPGHGWCNFYAGLLEEQLGHGPEAMQYYERSFRHAPELANPKVNPEVLASELALGARLTTIESWSFQNNMPMRYLQPNRVDEVREHYEQGGSGPAAPAEEPAAPESEAPAAEEPGTHEAPSPTAGPEPAAASEPATQPPPPRRVPTRAPQPTPPAGTDTPYGTAPIPQASDEAHLLSLNEGLWRLATAIL